MPFKRAGWLQLPYDFPLEHLDVSMPFKRAGWLQLDSVRFALSSAMFQCPLSGLVGCNAFKGFWGSFKLGFNAL